jgi:hypothetical protein
VVAYVSCNLRECRSSSFTESSGSEWLGQLMSICVQSGCELPTTLHYCGSYFVQSGRIWMTLKSC